VLVNQAPILKHTMNPILVFLDELFHPYLPVAAEAA